MSGVAFLVGLPAISAVVTYTLLSHLLAARKGLPMDRPNTRSLHAIAVPRVGGACIIAGVTAAATAGGFGPWPLPLLLALALLLASVSLVDDFVSVPFLLRLMTHVLGAGLFVYWAIGPAALLPATLVVVTISWMTNLYNFMDGSDGLAGGMTIIGFSTYAFVLFPIDGALAMACVTVVAAAAAFLIFNFHPAKVFLGDAGSVPLGFLAGAVGVLGWHMRAWPSWFPFLVFAPFILDATTTLLRRLLRGERVWQAHCEHYYQRLVRMGWGHRRTAQAEYGAMGYCAAVAVLLMNVDSGVQWVALALLPMACAMLWIDLRWAKRKEGDAA